MTTEQLPAPVIPEHATVFDARGGTVQRRLYFTMVRHPLGAKRAGNAYANKQDARDAVPLVRGSWRGLRVTISQCTLVWHDGQLTPKSIATLDRKYNLEPPCST